MVSKGYLQVLEALRILVFDLDHVECHFCGSFVLESGRSSYSTIEEAERDFRRGQRRKVVIQSHVNDPGRFEAMSQAAIARYRQAFTKEEHLSKLISLVLGVTPPDSTRERES